MANRKRDVQILLWVTPEEKKMIRKRMILSKTSNMSVYLRKMAIDGMIVNTDTTYLKAMYQEMHKIVKGKYEYVLTTHTDKKHIHSHLIFNATSFTDYHKYVSNKRTYHKLGQISNRICKEHGLSTSMPTSEAGRSYKEDMEYKRGQSWKAKLKYQIDRAI